eukprot:TRINITY_DN14064_c0_g1_i1.p1 TRINITY_DN14064_c0_g1~~TRINITY_DN14064_c0_g1_i1.p1  ORF type:complete len:381 (-),score=89.71 TRINITY_DN14064_c0_g1_i1:428-1570(-)
MLKREARKRAYEELRVIEMLPYVRRLQAYFRGQLARKRVRNLRADKRKQKENAAALKIQSSFRGNSARNQCQSLRDQRMAEAEQDRARQKTEREELKMKSDAATKIQSLFRGNATRQELHPERRKSAKAMYERLERKKSMNRRASELKNNQILGQGSHHSRISATPDFESLSISNNPEVRLSRRLELGGLESILPLEEKVQKAWEGVLAVQRELSLKQTELYQLNQQKVQSLEEASSSIVCHHCEKRMKDGDALLRGLKQIVIALLETHRLPGVQLSAEKIVLAKVAAALTASVQDVQKNGAEPVDSQLKELTAYLAWVSLRGKVDSSEDTSISARHSDGDRYRHQEENSRPPALIPAPKQSSAASKFPNRDHYHQLHLR